MNCTQRTTDTGLSENSFLPRLACLRALVCVAWFLASGCAGTFDPIATDTISRVSEEGKGLSLQPKKRIFVLPTINRAPHGGPELAYHAQTQIHDFVIGQEELLLVQGDEKINVESFLSKGGLEYNWKVIFERARSYGILGVIGSSIEEVWYRESADDVGIFQSKHRATGMRVTVQLFDVTTEREVAQSGHVGELNEEFLHFFATKREPMEFNPDQARTASSRALDKPLGDLMPHLKRLGWSGRIAKIDFHKYYLNAGEISGLQRGQLLKVFGEGAPIFDPDTGVFIGRSPGAFKGVLRVVDFFGKDGAVAVLHSGGNVREKDRIEVYKTP
jgi:hypothetical protein